MVKKYEVENILGVSPKVRKIIEPLKNLSLRNVVFFLLSFAVENLEHCDFIALRNMVIRTHLQDLKDVTNNVHYENFRCRTLAGLGKDGKPIKVTNK